MTFIVSVIGPGKISLMCKIYFVHGYITATLPLATIDDQVCYPGWWISGHESHTVT